MSERAGSRALVLFTRDLRLRDQAALAEAARFGAIVPALVLDDALRRRVGTSPRRAAYFEAAVASLDASLRARGSALVVRRGDLATAVLALARECGATTVLWSRAYDRAAVAQYAELQSSLEEAGLRAYGVHDALAVAPEETAAARSDASGRGYRSLSAYLAVWREMPSEPMRTPLTFVRLDGDSALVREALPRADECAPRAIAAIAAAAGVAPPVVSEASVRFGFERYLATAALQYDVASRVPASGPTARLSAPLAFGVVAARTLRATIDERAAEPFLLTEERVALGALRAALGERDFFLQLAHFYEESPDEPLRDGRRGLFLSEHPQLGAWREGRTGYPLVDAGIRQLIATGWMHPHVRRVAASFLCFDLGVDWRVGRETWEALLEEDDLALATGNWQWSAGVGADLAAVPRIFNPMKQLRRYDPELRYVRQWIPELADVPASEILGETTRPRPQLALALYGDRAYPPPILDHETAARGFLERYAAAALAGPSIRR